jgi:hypothetical protein
LRLALGGEIVLSQIDTQIDDRRDGDEKLTDLHNSLNSGAKQLLHGQIHDDIARKYQASRLTRTKGSSDHSHSIERD